MRVLLALLCLWLMLGVASAQMYGTGWAGLRGLGSPQAGPKPPDLRNLFIAVWSMDEANNSTRANASVTSCGSTCDLDESSGDNIPNDTTNKKEGDAAADFNVSDQEWLECSDGNPDNCGGTTLLDKGTRDWSFGCWARRETVGALGGAHIFMAKGVFTNGGYILDGGNVATDQSRCVVADSSGNLTDTAANLSTANEYYHLACVFDEATTDTLTLYVDAVSNGSASGTNIGDSNTSEDFALGVQTVNKGSGFMNGLLDECWVIARALTNAEVCHICSCTINGQTGPCTCDASNTNAYFNKGLNTSDCSSCTLPTNCMNPMP